MNLNEEIRDAFREGDQTPNGRLVTALKLIETTPKVELLEYLQYTINYVHDLDRAAAWLTVMSTGSYRKGCFTIRTWTGKTAFMQPTAYVKESKDVVEYAMSVLESAPFGDTLTLEGEECSQTSIIVDERTLRMTINLTNWAEASDTPRTEWQCTLLGNELQGELTQLAWIALEVSARTKTSLQSILKLCQY